MSYTAEEQAILGDFNTFWADQHPVAWPNVEFEKPQGSPWVRVKVQRPFGGAFQADLSTNPRYRHSGVFFVQIYTPSNVMTAQGLTLADSIADHYRARKLGSISFRTPSVRDTGLDGAWYQHLVSCPFWRDTVFP